VIEIITNGLEAIGLEIEQVPLDQTSLDAAAVEGSYEIGVFGFGGLGGDPDQLRRSFASQSQTRGFSRALGYNNPEFDTLAGAQLSMTDPAARQDAIFEMQTMLADDLPVLPLYYTARVVIFNADVFDNWYYTPGGWGGGIPMPYNKHQFIVGQPTGLEIRE
jgi:peptide/nickel transport system substrate-binding protein